MLNDFILHKFLPIITMLSAVIVLSMFLGLAVHVWRNLALC